VQGAVLCEGAAFEWHVDADPSSFPDGCRWVEEFGDYCNGQPGKPLFVSLVVYTDAAWPPSTHADTLFVQPEGSSAPSPNPRLLSTNHLRLLVSLHLPSP